MILMFIKNKLRQVLPPSLAIRLIATTNYKSGEPELKILKDLVDPNKNSIDIGANKGVYTYFLSQLSRQVFAYEPNPELAKFLVKAVGSKVNVYPIALSNEEGAATLSVPIVDTFEYDQLGSLKQEVTDTEKMKTFTVPLKRLDDQGHTNVGFVKIDVEGHEESVLEGAYNLLTTQRPNLLIEIEQKHHSDKNIATIFSRILALGYEGYFLLNGTMQSIDKFDKLKHQCVNNYEGLSSLGKTYVCNFIFKPRLN